MPPSDNTTHNKLAFTLIEVLVVIALIAVLAAIVAAGFVPASGRSQLNKSTYQLAYMDQLARDTARRTGQSVHLIYDLRSEQITLSDEDDLPLRNNPAYVVPHPVVMDQMVFRGAKQSHTVLSVPVSARGMTPSYAVGLSLPNHARWTVFCGLSGQSVEVADEDQALSMVGLAKMH